MDREEESKPVAQEGAPADQPMWTSGRPQIDVPDDRDARSAALQHVRERLRLQHGIVGIGSACTERDDDTRERHDLIACAALENYLAGRSPSRDGPVPTASDRRLLETISPRK